MEQQEIIALERGEVALDYAVRLLDHPYQDNSDRFYRTL